MHLCIIYLYMFLSMCTHSSLFVFACTDANVRGPCVEISSLLLSCMFSGSNSECQTWQVLLPVEPKIHCPRILPFLTHFLCVCDCGRSGVLIGMYVLSACACCVPNIRPPGLLQMVVSPQCVMRKSSECS